MVAADLGYVEALTLLLDLCEGLNISGKILLLTLMYVTILRIQ